MRLHTGENSVKECRKDRPRRKPRRPHTQAIKRASGTHHGEIPGALKGPDSYINIQGLRSSRHQKYLGFARLVRELWRRTGDGEDEDDVLVDKTGAATRTAIAIYKHATVFSSSGTRQEEGAKLKAQRHMKSEQAIKAEQEPTKGQILAPGALIIPAGSATLSHRNVGGSCTSGSGPGDGSRCHRA